MKRILIGLIAVAVGAAACSGERVAPVGAGPDAGRDPVILVGDTYPAGMVSRTVVHIREDGTREVKTSLITSEELKIEEATRAELQSRPTADRAAYGIVEDSGCVSSDVSLFNAAYYGGGRCPAELCFYNNGPAGAQDVSLASYVFCGPFGGTNLCSCLSGYRVEWAGNVHGYTPGDQEGCFSATSSDSGSYINFTSGSGYHVTTTESDTNYLWLNQSCGCPTGDIECSSSCVNWQTDSSDCGRCGTTCTGGESCVSGVCACTGGEILCSGTCVSPDTDTNCGACGVACNNGSCSTGSCVCSGGDRLCGTTCVNESNDPNNCGSCGYSCAAEYGAGSTCTGGVCGCPSGDPTFCSVTHDCTNLQTDPLNCGACDNSCPDEQSCVSGACSCTRMGGCFVTPTAYSLTMGLGEMAQPFAFDSSAYVPQDGASAPLGLFSLALGSGPQLAYEYLATNDQSAIGTQALSGIAMSPTSRTGGGEDTLWGIDLSGSGTGQAHVWDNAFTTSGTSVVFGTWAQVADIPGPYDAGQRIAVGVNSAGAAVIFAMSSTAGFASACAAGATQCGEQEYCNGFSVCACGAGTYLYQLNTSTNTWVPVAGPTMLSGQAANACASEFGFDNAVAGSTPGDLLVVDQYSKFWAMSTTGPVGQSLSAWGSGPINTLSSLDYGPFGMTAYNSQLITSGGNYGELFYVSGTTAVNIADAITSVMGDPGYQCYRPLNMTFDPYSGNLWFGSTGNWLCEWTACEVYNACREEGGTACPNPGPARPNSGACCEQNIQCSSGHCTNDTCQ